MSASLQAAQIIRCINASVSCLASSFIVLMILTEPVTGLASPYSRIIFGMSISDILFSLGILLSPFVGPKDNPDAMFAIGSSEGCDFIGFFGIIGGLCLVSYTFLLTYYFLKRIKYKTAPKDFTEKEEKYFHVFFIVHSISAAATAAASGSINPKGHGSICMVESYPFGCDRSSDIPCQRGGDKMQKILGIYLGAYAVIGFLAIFLSLSLCIHHVYRIESQFIIPAREIGNAGTNRRRYARDGDEEENNEHEFQDEGDAIRIEEKNKFILTKQALHQSLLYMLAFVLVYLPPILGNFTEDVSEWRFWFRSLLTPLGGVFNILIYTRPKVLKMKESYPEVPAIELLIAIVVTGGNIPSMADINMMSTSPQNHHRRNENNQERNCDNGEQQNDASEGNANGNLRYVSSNPVFDGSSLALSGLSYDLDISRESKLLSSMFLSN